MRSSPIKRPSSSKPALLSGEPVVEVTRGDIVESVHRACICASDSGGNVLLRVGEIDEPVFLRSTAKPFIAAAVLASGAGERFGLEPQEIAVMAASHFGEPFHVAAVRSILRKIEMDESALLCGAHYPYHEETSQMLMREGIAPSPVYNNCSGKHAGILALCRTIDADPTTYLSAANPAQRCILSFCARASDDDPDRWPIGVDGCGIPVYATSLRRAALAFARLATLEGLCDEDASALRAVREAMIAFPEYGSGTGEFDAELMLAGGGSIASKVGAEGVHGVACIGRGAGFASKIVDGGSRARPPVTVAALAALGALGEAAVTKLGRFARPVVYNRAGEAVGAIRTVDPNPIIAIEKAR